MSSTAIDVGYIAGAHGVHGEIKLKLFNAESTLLEEQADLTIRKKDGSLEDFAIEHWRVGSKCFLVRFRSVKNRRQAESLKGTTVILRLAESSLEDEEVYLETLRGFEVEDETHGTLGVITSFMSTNVDILVIKNKDGDETLIPILEETLRDVLVKDKRIVVRTPEGLIEG